MTEAEWLVCGDPWRMLRVLQAKRSSQRLRVLLCALCRQSWSLFDRDSGSANIELAERMISGSARKKELQVARRSALFALVDGMGWREEDADFMLDRFDGFHFEDDPAWVRRMANLLVTVRALAESVSVRHVTQVLRAISDTNEGAADSEDCALIREVIGNPFRPITFNSAWRTSDVMLLAQGVYEEKAFDRMPILADALQDAGCGSEDILNHCRDASLTHVRGCWVLDLVLGKE